MSSTIPVSELPEAFQDQVDRLGIDRDGAVGASDIALIIDQMDRADSNNKLLGSIAKSFGALSIILVCSVVGSSIAAARLSNDIEVDRSNGFAYVKGTRHLEVMKTSEALYFEKENIVDVSNEKLAFLKEIFLNDGDIRFVVKGHARVALNDDVMVLVEGGTLNFGVEGLTGATGDALTLIKTSIGTDANGRDSERILYGGGSMTGNTYSGSWTVEAFHSE